jgi:hypothetical protein
MDEARVRQLPHAPIALPKYGLSKRQHLLHLPP